MAIPTDQVIEPTVPINLLEPISFDIFPVLRIGLIVFLLFYLVLAIMVIKQIVMMMKTVKSSGNGFLLVLAYLHLAVVIATLAFSLFAL